MEEITQLSQLGRTETLDSSGVRSFDAYLQEYNAAYQRLARGLNDAMQAFRESCGVHFGDEAVLAAVEYKLFPHEERADPFKLIVTPDERFYPTDLVRKKEFTTVFPTTETYIPLTQLEQLVEDLKVMRGHIRSEYIDSDYRGRVFDTRLGANIVHRILVTRISAADNMHEPCEDLFLGYQSDEQECMPVRVQRIINPDDVNTEEDLGYKINKALATYAHTRSNPNLPIALNRLMLMEAVINYLNREIKERVAGSVEEMQFLGKVGRQ